MKKIKTLIQTENELIAINRIGVTIGRITSKKLLVGYDEHTVILFNVYENSKNVYEIRDYALNLIDLKIDAIDQSFSLLNQETMKHFPMYSFKFTQNDYNHLILNYPQLDSNEKKEKVWKCAYSYILSFVQFIVDSNLVLENDFHENYLKVFTNEIEEAVLNQSFDPLDTDNRLEEIFLRITHLIYQ
jgi:hypothetical protein